MNEVEKYYQDYDEESRLIKDNSHKIEFITTTHVLDPLIEDESNILEIGAATGRYSFYYLEKGHKITAVDKVPKHVDMMKSKKDENEHTNIDIMQGDGRDLSNFNNNTFDVVLCLGPLYHLPELKDRGKVIHECLRVLKPGGILGVAYINRYAQYTIHISRDKNYINDQKLTNVFNTGWMYGDERDCFYFTTYEEIEDLMKDLEIEKLDHVGTDGIVHMMRDNINALNDKEFEKWLDYHFKTMRNESLMGYSLHGLYVCRKKSN